jgi:hypothetical protein
MKGAAVAAGSAWSGRQASCRRDRSRNLTHRFRTLARAGAEPRSRPAARSRRHAGAVRSDRRRGRARWRCARAARRAPRGRRPGRDRDRAAAAAGREGACRRPPRVVGRRARGVADRWREVARPSARDRARGARDHARRPRRDPGHEARVEVAVAVHPLARPPRGPARGRDRGDRARVRRVAGVAPRLRAALGRRLSRGAAALGAQGLGRSLGARAAAPRPSDRDRR